MIQLHQNLNTPTNLSPFLVYTIQYQMDTLNTIYIQTSMNWKVYTSHHTRHFSKRHAPTETVPPLDNLMMIFDEDGDEIRNASFCRHSANIIPFSTMASGIFSRTVLSLNVVHHRNKITNKMVSGVGGSTRYATRRTVKNGRGGQ